HLMAKTNPENPGQMNRAIDFFNSEIIEKYKDTYPLKIVSHLPAPDLPPRNQALIQKKISDRALTQNTSDTSSETPPPSQFTLIQRLKQKWENLKARG